MSQTVDANVLLHASNRDSTEHERARAFVQQLARGPELVMLFWPTLFGYLRISTHPGIFRSPLDPAHAADNVAALLERPHIRAAGELDEFWEVYRRVSQEVNPRGNLVPDAHIVALMHQHSVSVIWTQDRDFRKFEGITQADPFA